MRHTDHVLLLTYKEKKERKHEKSQWEWANVKNGANKMEQNKIDTPLINSVSNTVYYIEMYCVAIA